MATAQRAKNDVITKESSLMVTQNILVVLLSQLCYVRNIFPEEAFNESKFGNCIIRALQQGVDDEADRILKWLEDGVFQLLRKGTLVMMVLGIFVDPSKSAEFVEAWYFRIGCEGRLNVLRERDGTTKTFLVGSTREHVKELSQNFVRTVIALGGALRDLPKERYLTMRMINVDDGSANPKGWLTAPDDQEFISFVQKPTKLSLGSLATPFNSVSLQLKTTVEDEACSSEASILERYMESQMDAMWQSESESDDELTPTSSNSNSNALTQVEMEALCEIMHCCDTVVDRRRHPLFRFHERVISKMIEIGALVHLHRSSDSFQLNIAQATRIYNLQSQHPRQASPDLAVQLSQIAVSSPASSTIISEVPNYGKDRNNFAASTSTRRVYPAVSADSGPPKLQTSWSITSPHEAAPLRTNRDNGIAPQQNMPRPTAGNTTVTAVVGRAIRISKPIAKGGKSCAPPLDFIPSKTQTRNRRQ